MRNEEWIEMFRIIPAEQHNQLIITLKTGVELVVDVLFRFEPNFVVLRGRQTGQIEEKRAFFVPYGQMLCFRLERIVKLQELYQLYNEEPPADAIEDNLGQEKPAAQPAVDAEKRAQATRAAAGKAPATMLAGAGAGPAPETNGQARNNLLERIRAARATSGGSRNGSNTQPS